MDDSSSESDPGNLWGTLYLFSQNVFFENEMIQKLHLYCVDLFYKMFLSQKHTSKLRKSLQIEEKKMFVETNAMLPKPGSRNQGISLCAHTHITRKRLCASLAEKKVMCIF